MLHKNSLLNQKVQDIYRYITNVFEIPYFLLNWKDLIYCFQKWYIVNQKKYLIFLW